MKSSAIVIAFTLSLGGVLAGCMDDSSAERAASPTPYERCLKRNGMEDIERDRQTVKVFVRDDITAADLRRLRDRIDRTDGVREVEYVSKDDALEKARRMFKDSPDVITNIPGNPFPASFVVRIKFEKSDDLVRDLEGRRGIDEIKRGGEAAFRAIQILCDVDPDADADNDLDLERLLVDPDAPPPSD